MFVNLVYDPAVLAPICFNEQAAREDMPYYELRTKLALKGQSPAEIRAAVEKAHASGELPKCTSVSFATCGQASKIWLQV